MTDFKPLLISSILISATVSSAGNAQDDDNIALFDDMIVFGDSLSDPGNLPRILNGLNIPGAPYFENQFSNGPVYTYLVDDFLGFEANRDLNFAIGGARSGPGVTQVAGQRAHISALATPHLENRDIRASNLDKLQRFNINRSRLHFDRFAIT